ncbi:mitochondrial intermembrane space import and assembly protein 40 homolog [Phalaenopsis equestris]|uniref:mitochondrial intermembrane space import and assembly protein 40 homolog n=1 Tax=Phalaenopsis equestris TaxID=78828 RepID=UPI0009E5DE7A|nr:mitochondrial intermembrane space import and assembly protein 40 homolog [Phalaenopsis equestris]
MGQSQSGLASEDEGKKTPSTSTVTPNSLSSTPSMEDLIAEATAEGGDENETLDQKAQRALECPCVADLRKGPCGSHFSEAFVCFIKSTAEEKGSDCVSPFVALQNCIRANPDAFSKDILEAEDDKEEEQVQEYKIYPPSWSKEPK